MTLHHVISCLAVADQKSFSKMLCYEVNSITNEGIVNRYHKRKFQPQTMPGT